MNEMCITQPTEEREIPLWKASKPPTVFIVSIHDFPEVDPIKLLPTNNKFYLARQAGNSMITRVTYECAWKASCAFTHGALMSMR